MNNANSTTFRRLGNAVRTLSHGFAYARHLVKGNYIAGDLSWIRRGSPPVILCHGFLGTRGTMLPLAKRFQADGRVVFSYHHGTFQLQSLRASAQRLVHQLERLEQSLGLRAFDVVGFSMGGLVALHALKYCAAHRWIRRLALLGAPTGGTWAGMAGVAAFGALSPSVWQVLPPSGFLQDLRDGHLPPGVKVRQVFASEDALCPLAPPLPGVDPEHDYIVMPGGHSSLVVARSFYERVSEFLTVDADEANDTAEWAAE